VKKHVHIISLGCPKNLIDSEVMAAALTGAGLHLVPDPHAADIIIINTCTFVLPAKEESIEEIFQAAHMKEEGRCSYLVVAGCMPQRYGRLLADEMPEVDLFVGINDIPRIASLVSDMLEGTVHSSPMDTPSFLMNASHNRILSDPRHTAYIKIAEGCSNHCSYCVIPQIRGPLRSREIDDVIREAHALAARGVNELILTAQETTAYGRDGKGTHTLATLMKELAAIDDLRWIRLLYTYPSTITDDLLHVIADEDKICNYIDIPIQHSDDTILRSMNRRGDSALIRHVIDRARAIIPGVALRTSLIVGYPGETMEIFDALVDFIHEIRFDHLGAFAYSPEEGTPAAEFAHQVSEDEKEVRKDIIMEEQALISYDINQSLIGSVQEVIIEGPSGIPGYTMAGRSKRQAPDIDGVTYINARERSPGEIITCTIIDADEYDLYAEEILE
jgi:ribosomal protein S12 methylthiotransferase